jgi:hypothetical protein
MAKAATKKAAKKIAPSKTVTKQSTNEAICITATRRYYCYSGKQSIQSKRKSGSDKWLVA